jgi:WD40 repeat protein
VVRTYGEPRFHTDSELAALGYAPDGTLWSVEEAGWLRRWSSSGEQLHRSLLNDLETLWAFSPDAALVASASDDLALWTCADGAQAAVIQQLSWVTAIAFRPGNAAVATGHDDGGVRLWSVETQDLLAEFREHAASVSALAFSPDGTRLATAGEDRNIQIIDLASKKRIQTLRGHTDRIPALAWNKDGKMLVSAGWDTTARLWDTQTGQPILLLNAHADQVLALAFSPDGALLAVADSDNDIHVWDNPTSGKTLHVLRGHSDEIRALAFSPDGSRLASAGNDKAIHIWDPRSGLLLHGQNAHSRSAVSLALNPPRLASTCGATALEVWNLETGHTVPPTEAIVPHIAAGQPEPDDPTRRNMAPLVPTGAAFSPDGRWLVAGGSDSYLHVWDGANSPFQLRGHWGPVGVVTFAPNSTLFASACATDGTCWVWDVEKRDPFLLIPEAADGCSVEAVAFHPNSRWMACGGIDWMSTRGTDGATCVWDIVEKTRLFILEGGVSGLTFHPNGRWLAAATLDETVAVWDVTDATAPARRLSGHQERVRAVAFTPNGRWLVSGGDDRTLRIWDGETFELTNTWQLDTPVRGLAFSPDGTALFVANANTTCSQLNWRTMTER